jgi:hypothetical protein
MAPVIFFAFNGDIANECEQIAQIEIEGFPNILEIFYHAQLRCPIINPGPGFGTFGIDKSRMRMGDIFRLVGLGRGFTFIPEAGRGEEHLNSVIDDLPLFQGTFWVA